MLSSALTNAERMTMPAAIAGAITAESDTLLMQGVAGAVSIPIPLLILVALFQKQIVSGHGASGVFSVQARRDPSHGASLEALQRLRYSAGESVLTTSSVSNCSSA